MIGFVAGEGTTHFEFYPVLGRKFRFSFQVPNFTTDDQVKEWGFMFTGSHLWVMRGDETSFYAFFLEQVV